MTAAGSADKGRVAFGHVALLVGRAQLESRAAREQHARGFAVPVASSAVQCRVIIVLVAGVRQAQVAAVDIHSSVEKRDNGVDCSNPSCTVDRAVAPCAALCIARCEVYVRPALHEEPDHMSVACGRSYEERGLAATAVKRVDARTAINYCCHHGCTSGGCSNLQRRSWPLVIFAKRHVCAALHKAQGNSVIAALDCAGEWCLAITDAVHVCSSAKEESDNVESACASRHLQSGIRLIVADLRIHTRATRDEDARNVDVTLLDREIERLWAADFSIVDAVNQRTALTKRHDAVEAPALGGEAERRLAPRVRHVERGAAVHE